MGARLTAFGIYLPEACAAFNDLSFPISEEIHKEVLRLPKSQIMSMNKVIEKLNVYNK